MLAKELLPSLSLRLINVDFHRRDKSWNHKNVNSPFSRLYLITEGEAFVYHNNKKYHLKPGTLHLIPCFTLHSCECPKSFGHYFVHFTSNLTGGADLFSIQRYTYHLKANGNESALFDRLMELNPKKRLEETDPEKYNYRCLFEDHDKDVTAGEKLESDGILRQLLSPIVDTSGKYVDLDKLEAYRRFADVLNYVDKNLDRNIALEDLGMIAELHPNYFSNLFSRLMGMRPLEYVNRKRVERAQVLLLITDHILNEIAAEVGFCDWSYFCRVFKKYIGMTPGAYRKRHAAS